MLTEHTLGQAGCRGSDVLLTGWLLHAFVALTDLTAIAAVCV